MHVTSYTRYILIFISQCVGPEGGRSAFWLSQLYALAFLALWCVNSPLSVGLIEHFSCNATI